MKKELGNEKQEETHNFNSETEQGIDESENEPIKKIIEEKEL